MVVAGGVWADRLPRSLVLVGASLVQGGAQAGTAGYILLGGSSVWPIIALQAAYGIGGGLVVPAETGLIPQTVSRERLQQANALQGLARNWVGVIGPAGAGVIIVLLSPGVALAADAASFFVCAGLLSQISAVRRAGAMQASFVEELREGWSEFSSRTWLWASVVLIGLGNAMFAGGWAVLGPAIAKDELGGAGAWAVIVAVGGVGAVMGGVVAFRYRPVRPLFAAVVLGLPMGAQLIALALTAPVWLLATANFVSNIGLSAGIALWFTVFQQQIPEGVQSRVSSYDTLGSIVLIPAAMAAIGPIANVVGREETLFATATAFFVFMSATAALPSVRAIRFEASPARAPRAN